MITIITGKKGSGKTQLLEELYREQSFGVGCITKKVYHNDQWVGYDLVRLPDEATLPFIRFIAHQEMLQNTDLLFYNRFAFSQKAFDEATRWMMDAIDSGNTPIWIDEVGNQELLGQGFDAVIRKALATKVEMKLVFRLHRFNELLAHYHITHYERINCKCQPV